MVERPPVSWRACVAALVTLCAVPVVLSLVLLWLPLLCCAVAVVRFRRVRRRRMKRCRGGGGGGGSGTSPDDGGGDRVSLLHKYLEDQMELVGGAEEGELSSQSHGHDPREA